MKHQECFAGASPGASFQWLPSGLCFLVAFPAKNSFHAVVAFVTGEFVQKFVSRQRNERELSRKTACPLCRVIDGECVIDRSVVEPSETLGYADRVVRAAIRGS